MTFESTLVILRYEKLSTVGYYAGEMEDIMGKKEDRKVFDELMGGPLHQGRRTEVRMQKRIDELEARIKELEAPHFFCHERIKELEARIKELEGE